MRYLKACVTLLLLSLGSAMLAQSTTATLVGIVHDSSGAVIPKAEVTATNTLTSFTRTVQSDDQGSYLFTNLPIGHYQVRVSSTGFKVFIQTGLTLDVSASARVDATLQLGEETETIQVNAESTGIDTSDATVGQTVSRERIQELPLNGRNAMQLAAVVPGVTNILSAPTVQTQSRSGPGLTVSGGRDTQNEFRFDGTSWKNITQNTGLNLPNPDALQEFQILTSSPGAEYGRNSGGIIIAVTRAGTNEFHGSLFEYFRNTSLNARNYFTRAPLAKPTLKQNQFGGTIGGPALHNKLFFFGSYQGTRIRQSQTLTSSKIPSLSQRSGTGFTNNATGAPLTLKNPIQGGTYAPGTVNPANFDPVALKLLSTFVPTATPGLGIVQLVSSPTESNEFLARGDYNVTPKDFFYVRYFRLNGKLTSQAGTVSPYAPSDTFTNLQNWAAQATHTFSPRLLNEFRLGVGIIDSNVSQKDTRQLSDFGAKFPGVVTPQLPNINISGYFNLATTDLFNEHDNIYQIGDTVRYTHGKHSISIGGEAERLELYNFGSSGNNGTLTFDGSQTGDGFADFLIGRPARLTQASPYHRNAKNHDFYVFAEDNYRVTNRLTVNMGVRYSVFQPFGITGGRSDTFRAGQQSIINPSAPLGMVFPGDAGVPSALVPTDKNNIAPRLGLAFDPRGDGRMSIRAAYGLFFEDLRSDIFTYAAVNQPFVISNTVNTPTSLVDPYAGHVNPFPYVYSPATAKFTFPMSLFTVPTATLNAPYVHNFSLSVQQELPGGMLLNIAYVGKLQHNLIRMLQANPAVYSPTATLANTDARRVFMPGVYSSFRLVCTCSGASYNSLQSSLSRRYANGFTFTLAYTYGKLLDYYSATNLGQTPQDPNNMRGDYGRSDFDRRHVFNASTVYNIPYFKNADRYSTAILSHWSVNGILGLSSGLPFSVTTGSDASLTAVGFDRTNVSGTPYRSAYTSQTDMLNQYFNTAAFSRNLPGQYGNSGRNSLTGPGLANLNLSLVRTFPLGEHFGRMQFRSEFFNALNHANFGQPDGNYAALATTFGKINTASDPRIMQFALRYQF